jgi:hypothetical protein
MAKTKVKKPDTTANLSLEAKLWAAEAAKLDAASAANLKELGYGG